MKLLSFLFLLLNFFLLFLTIMCLSITLLTFNLFVILWAADLGVYFTWVWEVFSSFCFKYTSCPFLISFWNSHNTNTVVSPYPLFLFPWFVTCGQPHSKNVKNSKNKHFISLKLHSLCKVMKSHSILPNMTYPFVQRIHTVYATHFFVT